MTTLSSKSLNGLLNLSISDQKETQDETKSKQDSVRNNNNNNDNENNNNNNDDDDNNNNNENENEKNNENIYLNMFLPLMLSMTMGDSKEYWNQTYLQQWKSFQNINKINQNDGYNKNKEEEEKENKNNNTNKNNNNEENGKNEIENRRKQFEEWNDSMFIWFGNETVAFIASLIQNLIGERKKDSFLLDLGTGNGHLCQVVRSLGFSHVFGSDYSSSSIELCREIQIMEENLFIESIQNEEGIKEFNRIEYIVDDITDTHLEKDQFQVVVDKGTLDSIAMTCGNLLEFNEEMERNRISPLILYADGLRKILKVNGYFILVSCNHSLEEIEEILNGTNEHGFRFNLIQDYSILFEDLRIILFQKNFHFKF